MMRMLTEPESFFEQTARKRGLRTPFFILLFSGLFFALDMGLVYTTLGRAEFDYGPATIILTTFIVLVPSFVWIAYGFAVMIMVRLLGARARLGNIYRVTAYGFIPLGLAGAVWGIGRYIATEPLGCDYPKFRCGITTAPSLNSQTDAILSYWGRASGEPLFLAFFALGVLITLGSAYLWWQAVTQATTLEKREGAIAAGVPYLALIVLLAVFYL